MSHKITVAIFLTMAMFGISTDSNAMYPNVTYETDEEVLGDAASGKAYPVQELLYLTNSTVDDFRNTLSTDPGSIRQAINSASLEESRKKALLLLVDSLGDTYLAISEEESTPLASSHETDSEEITPMRARSKRCWKRLFCHTMGGLTLTTVGLGLGFVAWYMRPGWVIIGEACARCMGTN